MKKIQSTQNIRFKFTGKERGSETGYSYASTPLSTGFGARYIDSDLILWLSVDPLADKYPSMSPFMYTAGNPVILVDPDGRGIWELGEDNKLTLKEKNNDKFIIFKDSDGNEYFVLMRR